MSRNPQSPKRRRTGSGPISADAIAQANSTAQVFVFAGQRQNRWMQGGARVGPNGDDASYVQMAANPRHGAVNSQEHSSNTRHMTFPDDDAFNKQAPNPDVSTRRATTIPSNVSTNFLHSLNIVNYESPYTSTTPNITEKSGSRKSLERKARTATQPSLPSPAPSDENANSPIISAPVLAMPVAGAISPDTGYRPRNRRGRPPNSHVRVSDDGAFAGSGSFSSYLPRRQPRAVSTSSLMNVDSVSQAPSATHSHPGQGSSVLPSQTSAQPNQQSHGPYSQFSMRQRLDTFQSMELPRYGANEPDSGRLAVLRDAIDKQDWFYIVLSQIHSLTETPKLLPQSMLGLDPRAIAYLDNLVCPNRAISRIVRQWLADFPTPIMSVYSSPTTKDSYDRLVGNIRGFLERLLKHWDGIISVSKERLAPPLAQDLFETLGLESLVLQTTAFRAIARMLFSQTDDPPGLEQLEILHHVDQFAFIHKLKRNAHEKDQAYSAYRKTLQAWNEHKSLLRSWELRQQHLPPAQRYTVPAFIVPHEAAVIFQPWPIPQWNAPASALQPYAQQYQAMIMNQGLMQRNQTMANARTLPSQVNQNAAMQQRPPTPVQHVNTALPIPRQQHPPGPKLVLPHESEQPRAQPTQPDTARTALHQAHLRSPQLALARPKPDAPRLYRHFTAWALSPTQINKDMPLNELNFSLARESLAHVPITVPSKDTGQPPTRVLIETSQTYRLRCCALTTGGFPDEAAWVGADTFWPDNLFFSINGVLLETRRKLHHGRYLPIDLTSYIRPGVNRVTAVVNRVSTDPRPFDFAVAVEIVCVMRHESIVSQVERVSAAESLASIKKSLSGNSKGDDIAITSNNLTIKLFDPYSGSKIFDIPVRGKKCAHRDCFDLETFLGFCKREQPGWPTVVDCWRCPLCRGDVRPQSLIVDGFLVEVREELAKQNLLDTRAIVVEADGIWKPQAKELTGVRSANPEREEQRRDSVSVRASSKKPVEVVEID